jgi:DNA-binding winged helix-turn-helix (wHTH) protein
VVTELAVCLACHQDRPRSAEEIEAAVWPARKGGHGVSMDAVRQHLSRLRRALGHWASVRTPA